jgi:hypothetical protein
VKWWLLALPQYVVVAVFAGGAWAGYNAADHHAAWSSGGGLIGLLVLISGVALLFTRRYPQSLFEFIMGMNRWVFRVAVYATLMTDAYPPSGWTWAPRSRRPPTPEPKPSHPNQHPGFHENRSAMSRGGSPGVQAASAS